MTITVTTTATFTKKRHKISEKTNENLDSINRTPSTKNKRFSAFLARYILNIVYTLLLMLTLKLCWFLYWISNLYWILNCIELLNSLHIFVLFLIILFCVKHEMVIVAAMAFQTFQNYKTCCDPNRKKQLLSKKKERDSWIHLPGSGIRAEVLHPGQETPSPFSTNYNKF